MIDGQFDKNTGAITLRASFPNANGFYARAIQARFVWAYSMLMQF